MARAIRLTKEIKNKIMVNLREDVMKEKEDAYNRNVKALGLDIVKAMIKGHEVAFRSLPDKFFELSSYVTVRFGKKSERVELPEPMRVPDFLTYYQGNENNHVFGLKHALTLRYAEIERSYASDLSDYEGLQAQVSGLMVSVTTVKKLLEIWPKGEKYLPPEALDANIANLPAVSTQGINDAIEKLKAA